MPDPGECSLRARVRAPPMMGGLLSVHRLHITADTVSGITLAAVSIPVALGSAKITGMPVVTGLYTLVDRQALIATRLWIGITQRG